MQVLVVSPVVPFAGINHAGGRFLHHHLERLRAGGVLLMAPDAPENRADRECAPAWLDVRLSPHCGPRSGSLQQQRDRVEHRLTGASPLPHVVRGLLAAGLVDLARSADLVELHWPEQAHLAPLLRRQGVTTPLVVVEYDVASDAATSTRNVTLQGKEAVADHLLRPLHQRRERSALNAASLLLVFKAADIALLRKLGVHRPIHVLDPWLEPVAGYDETRDPLAVLFTGALWRHENDVAARWLVECVWPLVLQDVPGARLTIAGDRPTPALKAAAGRANAVQVTGRLEDLGPEYARAGVFAAPLMISGGLKFKVPQAMAHGLPVVATTIAAHGVREVAPADTFWAVSDEPVSFAGALSDALSRPEAARRTGERAARWVAQHYSFESSGEGLLRAYADLVRREDGCTTQGPAVGADR